MIFELAQDFRDAVNAMPTGHSRRDMLDLLEEAIRRDIHFIHRHPTTLFQCMWNTCWWYDCPEAANHYEKPEGGWIEPPPWQREGERLCGLLERWLAGKQALELDSVWVRSILPPLEHLGNAQMVVMRGHLAPVTSVACSPDGRRIVSGSVDCSVRLWDAATGLKKLELTGFSSKVSGVAFSPDGARIVAAFGLESRLRVWDAESGEVLIKEIYLGGLVTETKFSPDGSMIAAAGSFRVWLCDSMTGKKLVNLVGSDDAVNCIAFSSDGEFIAGGSTDTTIRIWLTKTGKLLHTLRGHTAPVVDVAVSPAGNIVLSAAWDDTVRAWDAKKGLELCRVPVKPINALACSPDGKRFAMGFADGTIGVCDIISGQQLCQIKQCESRLSSLEYSLDGKRLILGLSDNSIRIVKAEYGGLSYSISGGKERLYQTSLSKDCSFIYTEAKPFYNIGDRMVRIRDTKSGLTLLNGYLFPTEHVELSPDERHAAVNIGCEVHIWKIERQILIKTLRGHRKPILKLAWRPDGQEIVTGSEDGTVRVWDVDSGREVYLFKISHPAHEVKYTGDGRRIIAHSKVGDSVETWEWDARTGRRVRLLRVDKKGEIEIVDIPGCGSVTRAFANNPKWVIGRNGLACSPDGKRLLGAADRYVTEWNADSGEILRCHRAHSEPINDVAYLPDGQRYATASWDGSVRIWNAENLTEVLCMFAHFDVVTCLACFPDGRRIASGSHDATVRVCDVDSGDELMCLRGHSGPVKKIALSPDSSRAATVSDDETLRVWDLENANEIFRIPASGSYISAVAFSPDGKRIATGSINAVSIYDSTNGNELLRIKESATTIKFSPDGKWIAGAYDWPVRVWDSASGAELLRKCWSKYSSGNLIDCVEYSPDGLRLLCSFRSGYVKVLDAESGAQLMELANQTPPLPAEKWKVKAGYLETAFIDTSVEKDVGWVPLVVEKTFIVPSVNLCVGVSAYAGLCIMEIGKFAANPHVHEESGIEPGCLSNTLAAGASWFRRLEARIYAAKRQKIAEERKRKTEAMQREISGMPPSPPSISGRGAW